MKSEEEKSYAQMCLIASLWGVFLDALNRKNISSKLLEFWPDQAGLSDHVYLPTGCHGHCVWTKWETQSQHCEGQKESDGYLTVLCIEWMEHHFFRGGGLPIVCGRREVETGWTSAFCEFYSQSLEVSHLHKWEVFSAFDCDFGNWIVSGVMCGV